MELYLIRHGQSVNNVGDLPRVVEPPLTGLGEKQAQRAGESLKGEGITRLYCSPMLRALQTAKIIGDILNLAPHVFVGLHEWGGMWEGQTSEDAVQRPGLNRSEMKETCPNVVLPDGVTDQGWWFGEWEGDEAIIRLAHENAMGFVAHLKVQHPETAERVAAVSHGGSGSSLISVIFGLPPDANYDRFSQNNTAISKIRMTPNRTHLRYLNRIDHLPPEAVT